MKRKKYYKIIPIFKHGDYFKLLKDKGLKNYLLYNDEITEIVNIRKSESGQTYFETIGGDIKHASYFRKLTVEQIKKINRNKKIKKILE